MVRSFIPTATKNDQVENLSFMEGFSCLIAQPQSGCYPPLCNQRRIRGKSESQGQGNFQAQRMRDIYSE